MPGNLRQSRNHGEIDTATGSFAGRGGGFFLRVLHGSLALLKILTPTAGRPQAIGRAQNPVRRSRREIARRSGRGDSGRRNF